MSTTLSLKPVKTVQVYEQVCEQILGLIVQGVWPPGFRLPSERELATQLAVSRPTIREAIAALNTRGVIDTRAGAGSYVSAVSTETLTEVTRHFVDRPVDGNLELSVLPDISPVALLEVREAVEPAVCGLAARRYRPSRRLEECLETMEQHFDPADPEDRALWSNTDRLFHREFAVITGNPVYMALAEFIADAMDQPLWQRIRDDALQQPGLLQDHAEEHRRIARSVAEGDVELSVLHARRHVVGVRHNMSLDTAGEPS